MSKYKEAGVNIKEGNNFVSFIKPKVKKTNIPGVIGNMGSFGGAFDLKEAGFVDPILISATDGVGTKLKVAIETGITNTVGIDLVAMCVNDLICEGAKPLFFLDYFATSKLKVSSSIKIIDGIIEGCKQAGCALLGGETAEMPDLYNNNDFDLAGFAVGALERGDSLPYKINNNDLIVGLPSSGFHSNGFALIRKVIKDENLNWESPNPINNNAKIKDELLIPTKIYQRILGPLISNKIISGLSHITGGGITENLPRILPNQFSFEIDLTRWELPKLMSWVIKKSKMTEEEALKTFNCGIGMICIVPKNNIQKFSDYFQRKNETFYIIGEVKKNRSNLYKGQIV
ncbi:MAG: phosphoribosylformylglycinamidine cyclo-ligase [Paracoccaceae bacterium]